jgi:hypothetical protein
VCHRPSLAIISSCQSKGIDVIEHQQYRRDTSGPWNPSPLI